MIKKETCNSVKQFNSKVELLLLEVNQLKFTVNNLVLNNNHSEKNTNSDNTGYIIINLVKKSLYWSLFFQKTLGYNPNTISSTFENLEELLHPSDKFTIDDIFNKKNRYEELFFKLRFRTKSQTYILLNSYLKAIN